MTWPTNPSGGAQVVINGVLYQYDSANTAWNRLFSTINIGAGLTSIATVTSNAQPNITSVGTLSNLSVSGNVTASYFIGNGSQLTGIDATVISNGTSNVKVTSSGGNIAVTVGGTANTVVFTSTGVNVAGTLNTGTGNANVGNLGVTTDLIVGGNMIVNGTTTSVNSTVTRVVDPIFEIGGGANGAALATNDSKDRGLLLHYYTTAPVDAFMGWDNSNAEFAFASNASLTGEVTTFNTFGNIRVGNAVLGNFATATYLHGILDSTSSSQPNISSVGTLTSLTVSGLITNTGTNGLKVGNIKDPSGTNTILLNTGDVSMTGNLTIGTGAVTGNFTSLNANLGNLAYANFHSGNGSLLFGMNASNIASGTIPSSILGNSTLYIGTTAIALNRASATLSLTGVANIPFTKYNETVVSGGSVTGTITPDAAAGTIYTYTLTGSITMNSLGNAVAGTSMTIVLTQGGTGSYTLTSSMKFAGGVKTLSTAVGSIDIIGVFYDGTTYYASLSKGYA
jgi:hypothetical protein